MADKEAELHDLSEEQDDESLREEYVLVTKPHTTSKVWVHFGLKGSNKDGLPDSAEVEKSICHYCHKVVLLILPICLPIYTTTTLKFIQK